MASLPRRGNKTSQPLLTVVGLLLFLLLTHLILYVPQNECVESIEVEEYVQTEHNEKACSFCFAVKLLHYGCA